MVVAFCENNKCREIFLFNLPGMGNVELIGGKAGPCPNCGGLGIIPDGLYDYVNNQITFIRGPQISL